MIDIHVKEQIRELYLDYVQCIDGDELEKWPEFFTDKCLYRITSRVNYQKKQPASVIYCDSKGMLKDRIAAYRHANIYEPHFYRHLVSDIRVLSAGEGMYEVTTNYVVLQTRLEGDTEVYNAGRYIDKVIFEEGAAKFKEKLVVYDTLRIPTLLVTPI